ncbi:MAG: YdbH domain-containing protein, partial [Pyrinomonadaceae bacterium]|nr:YdbH domain-containing protein [Pyrinomonadaceae bacterium]
MPEKEDEQEIIDDGTNDGAAPEPKPRGRRFLSRRNALFVGLGALLLAVVLFLVSIVSYRYGVLDTYVKGQFRAKMSEIGIVFDADVFRLTLNPLELELKNATFNDRVSGEKLIFVRDARIGLTVQDLFAWQLSRDITVDKTEINGAEVWIKFDEEGNSNFKNLVFESQEESNLNFRYESVRFRLRDATIHFGDLSRRIAGDANNLQLDLEPEDLTVPDEQKRYVIDLTSTDSTFTYDDRLLNDIDIRLKGIADRQGADITELRLDTPIGYSLLSGRLTDWDPFAYNLNVESSVDLTQTSNIFPLGATLRGVGNFKGVVSGVGESYRVEGQVNSDAIAAEGVYLKAVNVAATVEGTNSNYTANGTAVAELLTFEDFRIEFPKIAGNVRGTGSDFRWVGELQAAAAKTRSLTLGGLFLSDAVAELKDRELVATVGNGRAGRFSVAETEFAELFARDVRITNRSGLTTIDAPGATARSMTTPDYRLQGIAGRNLRVRDEGKTTTVTLDGVTADGANLKDNRASSIRADRLELTDVPDRTDIKLDNLRAETVNAQGTIISGVSAPQVTITDDPVYTRVYADTVRIAKIDGDGAILGSLNVAGVRLTIRQGRVEGTSNDIEAGDVTLAKNNTLTEGGKIENVRILKPVFVVEPSGRYRASADMSIGGGIVGTIPLGAATAGVVVTDQSVSVSNVAAEVMGGRVDGQATIAYRSNRDSNINAVFSGLDLSKLIALQSGRVIPFQGQTTGSVDLSFRGTDVRSSTGMIKADIAATAGNDTDGSIPVNGRIELTAAEGLFNVNTARLDTGKSQLTANGQFDLQGDNSALAIALNSTDAGEIDRLVRVLNVSPDLTAQLDDLRVGVAGELRFNGELTGNVYDPVINGSASIASLSLRDRQLGSVRSDVSVSPAGFELRNGLLNESSGGTVAFSVNAPRGGANNTEIRATLTNVNAGNLLAALPVELPGRLRDFEGRTSGSVELTGLPNDAQGAIDLAAANGTVGGQAYDSLKARAVFRGTNIDIETAEIRVGEGFLAVKGNYDRASTEFDLDITGQSIPLPLALSFLPESESVPTTSGTADLTAKATGIADRPATFNVTFAGRAANVVINDNSFGDITFEGNTRDQVLFANLTAKLDGRDQVFRGSVNFGNDDLPFKVEHELDQSPLRPFFALIPQLKGLSIGGTGTGKVEFGGNLSTIDANGQRIFTTAGLSGTARFTQLTLLVQDSPLVATEPVFVTFSPNQVNFESARFTGSGSNISVAGTVSFTESGYNNLAVDGRLNLILLNVFPQVTAQDAFFGGFAEVAVDYSGTGSSARLSGSAKLDKAAFSTFIGSNRLTMDRLEGRIIFTANQAQIEQATVYLGGGKFVASGGALFGDKLQLTSYRVALSGTNITLPLPEDFNTTGDARLEISGRRIGEELTTLIAGSILARRSVYNKDIDLANIISGRREGSISGGSAGGFAPRFDLSIEGRDALVIQNNIADLTASLSLRLTGCLLYTSPSPRDS